MQWVIKTLKKVLKEHQKLGLLLISLIGKRLHQKHGITPKRRKKFELNNNSVALNVLFSPHGTGKIRLPYKSKHNFKRKNQVVLVMITDGKKWHYLVVKKLSTLLRGITSKHVRNVYCLNSFHLYSTEKNAKNMKKYVMILIIIPQKSLLKAIKY